MVFAEVCSIWQISTCTYSRPTSRSFDDKWLCLLIYRCSWL